MFLSHTSELRRHPPERSFWAGARDAVERARYTVITMERFPAEAEVPAQVCEQEVRAADVYVLVAGFRYGSEVRDRTELSYTELEFETAGAAGKKRLAFLVDDRVSLPRDARDLDLTRQTAFRARVRDSGLTVRSVLSPDNLETELFHALVNLDSAVWSRDAYLDELRGRYRALDLDLMCPRPVTDGSPTLLEQIFVPPNTRAGQSLAELPKDVRRSLVEPDGPGSGGGHDDGTRATGIPAAPYVRDGYFARDPVPALDVLADPAAQRLVVLGDMGAGKSTLLRFFTLLLSDGLGVDAHGRGSVRWMADWLPVLVELSLYEDTLSEADGNLITQLSVLNARANIGLPPEVLTDHLHRGGPVVVMFDGLDEVADAGVRRELARRIVSFALGHTGVRVVVTSRTTGFLGGSVFAGAGFAVVTLQDFTPTQIIDFTHRWHARRPPGGRTVVDQAEQLKRAISESPSVRDLAGNPLLLTILAFMNGRRELPQDRFGVYGYAIDVLARHWDANRAVSPGTTAIDHINEDAIRELLRRVARRVQDSDGGIGANRIGRTALLTEIESYLRHRFEQLPKEAAADAAQILDQLRDRNFLLTEFEPGVYGFVQRAVLEFCVADELLHRPLDATSTTTTLDDVVSSAVRGHAHDPVWQEVLLLVAEKIPASLHVRVLEQLVADVRTADDLASGARLRLLTFGLRSMRQTIAARPGGELRDQLADALISEFRRVWDDVANDLDISAPALRELDAIARSDAVPLLAEADRAAQLAPWLGTYATGRAAILEMDKVLSVLRLGVQSRAAFPLAGDPQPPAGAADGSGRPSVFDHLRKWASPLRRKNR